MCQCIHGINGELNSRGTIMLLRNHLSRSLFLQSRLTDNLYLKTLESLYIFRGIILVGFIISGYVVREQFRILHSFIEIYFDRHDKEAKTHDQHYHYHCSPLHVSYTTTQTAERTFVMCVRVVMLQTTQTR